MGLAPQTMGQGDSLQERLWRAEAAIEKLEKEKRGLKSILSILFASLKSDYEYNTGLINRLLAMEETAWGGIDEELGWKRDSRFKVLDMDGEHDPVYVVTPNGETLEFNHTNDTTTDLTRAQFVADTLNEAWDKIRKVRI